MLRGLHKQCDKGNWEDVSISLSAPSGRTNAKNKGGWGDWCPLHLACKRDPPVEIILALIDAAPESTEISDMYQRFPIHYAAEWGASIEVLEALLKNSPQSLMTADIEGKTPLHLSFLGCNAESQQRRPPPNTREIKLLLTEDVLRTDDKDGNLPLHYACNEINSLSESSISILTEAYGDARYICNIRGQTPLHLALARSSEQPLSLRMLQTLIGNGTAVCMANDDGMLPLHMACKTYASFDVLDEILFHHKKGACKQDSTGKYPLEILEEIRPMIISREEIEEFNYKSDLLFAHFTNILPFRIQPDRLKRMEGLISYEAQTDSESLSDVGTLLWTFLCTFPGDDYDDLYSGCIEKIFEACEHEKDAITKLLRVKTENGTFIRDCINPNRSACLQTFLRFLDHYKIESGGDVFHKGDSSSMVLAKNLSIRGEKPQDVIFHFEANRMKFQRKKMINDLIFKGNQRISDNVYVVPIIQTFDADRVGSEDEEELDKEFCAQMKVQEELPKCLLHYRCATVMPKGHMTLDNILRHQKLSDRKKLWVVKNIAWALEKLHEKNVVYGNIHARNMIEFGNERISLIDLGASNIMSSEYMLGTHTTFISKSLTPELVARLNASEHKRYLRYWKSVQEASMISDLFCEDDITYLTIQVNSYLGMESTAKFEMFWEHINSLSKLWIEIRPQQIDTIGEDGKTWYFVPKCYISAHKTSMPYKEKCLPYDLVPAFPSHDTYGLGLFLIDLYGRQQKPFGKSLTLQNLYHFKIDDLSDYIKDPLVRHLARSLISKVNVRPKYIKQILGHPFFASGGKEQMLRKARQAILQTEYRYARNEKIKQSKQKKLVTRTISAPSLLTIDTQMKLLCSTSSQWKSLLPKDRNWEFVFPTSFVILPYRLNDGQCSTKLRRSDLLAANHYAIHLAQMLHLTTITCQVGEINCDIYGHVFSEKLAKYKNYVKARKTIFSHSIFLCEDLVNLAMNATSCIKDMIEGILNEAEIIAETMVNVKISNYVDIHQCKRMMKKIKEAQEMFEQVFDGIVSESTKNTKEVVYDQLESIVDRSFQDMIIRNHSGITKMLNDLVLSFSKNPVMVCKQLLAEEVEEVIKVFREKAYFYFVDEYDGKIITSDEKYPIEIGIDLARTLLPSMGIVINYACRVKSYDGLGSLVGLEQNEATFRNNLSILQLIEKTLDQESSSEEFTTLQNAANFDTIIQGKKSIDFEQGGVNSFRILQNFVEKKDPYSKYARMVRLKTADEFILWTSKEGAKKVIKDSKSLVQNNFKLNRDCQEEQEQKSSSDVNTINSSLNSLSEQNIFVPPDLKTSLDSIYHCGKQSHEIGSVMSSSIARISCFQSAYRPALELDIVPHHTPQAYQTQKSFEDRNSSHDWFHPEEINKDSISNEDNEFRDDSNNEERQSPNSMEFRHKTISPISIDSLHTSDDKQVLCNETRSKNTAYRDKKRHRWGNALSKVAEKISNSVPNSKRQPFSPRNDNEKSKNTFRHAKICTNFSDDFNDMKKENSMIRSKSKDHVEGTKFNYKNYPANFARKCNTGNNRIRS